MMTTCSRPIYPPAVIQNVIQQMSAAAAAARDHRTTAATSIPALMQVKPCLRQANLRDAVVRKNVAWSLLGLYCSILLLAGCYNLLVISCI